ncbi:MAG: glycosyltransferase family 4 protein [Candidatus Marsarchaeota archaeon]|nr:glycosyltransferase family 4 protein [Candidatus Marsarchaeota archaeon]
MNGLKIGILIPDVLDEFHVNRNPLEIPLTLRRLRVDTLIFAPGNKLLNTKDLPKIIRLVRYKKDSTTNLIRQIDYAIQLNKHIKKENPNIMIFFTDTITAALIKLRHPRLRIVFNVGIEQYDFRDFPHSKLLTKLSFAIKYFISDLLMSETQHNYEITVKFVPFVKKKLKIIRVGVPDTFFLTKKDKAHRTNTVLCVARITRFKAQDMLIRSFNKLYKKHRTWRLRFVGSIEDRSYFNDLKNLVKKYGLSDKITFLNFITEKEIRKEYLNASIFCLCSSKENPGIVRGEAMAMGLPIVTTATSGSELVTGRGIVIPIGDERALTLALDKFMSSPKERDRASKLEREWVERIRADVVIKDMLLELGYNIE